MAKCINHKRGDDKQFQVRLYDVTNARKLYHFVARGHFPGKNNDTACGTFSE